MQERKKVNLDAGVLYDATVLHVNPFKCRKWVFFFFQNSATYWEGKFFEAESLQQLYWQIRENNRSFNHRIKAYDYCDCNYGVQAVYLSMYSFINIVRDL